MGYQNLSDTFIASNPYRGKLLCDPLVSPLSLTQDARFSDRERESFLKLARYEKAAPLLLKQIYRLRNEVVTPPSFVDVLRKEYYNSLANNLLLINQTKRINSLLLKDELISVYAKDWDLIDYE